MRLPRRLRHGQAAELTEHLGELRSRVLISFLAVAAGTIVAFIFHERLIHLLNAPLPADHARPITLGVAEPFMTSLKVSILAGFALAFPIVIWQVWAFIAPAVKETSQRLVTGLVLFASGLFAAGVVFGYIVALPAAVRFLTSFDSELYDIEVRASSYYSFVSYSLLSVGLVFDLPVVMLGLVALGVISTATLRSKRRHGYALMAAIAVVLPGVDPVTTGLLMVPLLGLYEGSIWLCVAMERRRESVAPNPV